MDWRSNFGVVRWLVSGLLLGSGFVVTWLWPLGLLGAVIFIRLSIESDGGKKSYVFAWLAWSIKVALAVLWLWSTYPISWLPSELGKIQLLIVGFFWISSAFTLGLGGVVAHWIIRIAKRFLYSKPLLFDLVVAFGWVLAELSGSLIYSIVMFGPGGSVTAALSFSYTGYLLVAVPGLLVVAKAFGAYGLSYLFAVISVTVVRLMSGGKGKVWLAPAIALSLLSVSVIWQRSWVVEEMSTLREYKVVIVDTSFPPELLRYREGTQLISAETKQAMMMALSLKPDYIILPEDARFFDQTIPAYLEKDKFTKQFNNPESVIVDSGRVTIDGRTYVQSFLYGGPEESVEQVHKRYLVPQGEFISYWMSGLLEVFGYGPVVEKVRESMSYEVGPNTNQSEMASHTPVILFCFESVDPFGVRRLLQERPDAPFIAHPISHSWFHQPTQLWQEFDTMLRVQAVWNKQYIISAGSNVEGKVYTPAGEIILPKTVKEDVNWKVREVVIKTSY